MKFGKKILKVSNLLKRNNLLPFDKLKNQKLFTRNNGNAVNVFFLRHCTAVHFVFTVENIQEDQGIIHVIKIKQQIYGLKNFT